MLIKQAPDIRSSEITPQSVYLRAPGVHPGVGGRARRGGPRHIRRRGCGPRRRPGQAAQRQEEPAQHHRGAEPVRPRHELQQLLRIRSGAGDGPKANSKNFKPRPWKLQIDGLVNKPGSYDIDEFMKPYALEERIYRFRCVEAWSFVIPWVGIPMAEIIKRVEPTSKAAFVEFTTLQDTGRFPMQRTDLLEWPYIEGLRLDEAQHPLTLLAVGLYGEVLPAQNGAPIRLVVPWKYGFKGAKSLARIRFVDKQPLNTWQKMARNEYGFYANVNPQVDHPRWSQAREKRLPSFIANHRTEMFNGYADQVQSLYAGMDLRKNF
jgi:sulfoxide reductase catalytic subunit YedY